MPSLCVYNPQLANIFIFIVYLFTSLVLRINIGDNTDQKYLIVIRSNMMYIVTWIVLNAMTPIVHVNVQHTHTHNTPTGRDSLVVILYVKKMMVLDQYLVTTNTQRSEVDILKKWGKVHWWINTLLTYVPPSRTPSRTPSCNLLLNCQRSMLG